MKVLKLDCACGDKTCNTYLTMYVDEEKPQNIILAIKDDKNELESWFSLDREKWFEIEKFMRGKYKRE